MKISRRFTRANADLRSSASICGCFQSRPHRDREETDLDNYLQFLIKHGYVVLFVWVFAEQVGLPLPAIPILLAAGALAGKGDFSFAVTITLAVLAALMSDIFWYKIGRRKGGK